MAFMCGNIGKNTAHVNGYVTAFRPRRERSLYRSMLNDVLARVHAKLEEVGLSASAASLRAGLSRDAIRNMERAVAANGRKGVSTRTITALAPILGTTSGWLLEGVEGEHIEDSETIDVPVLSNISAGTFRAQDGVREADIERHIKVSHLPKGDWIALEVDGDSMDRLAPPGSVVIVNRAEHDPMDGKHYIFSLDDGAATFKQFRKDPEPMLVPQSFNPNHYAVPVGDRELYVFGRVRRVITDL